MQKIETNAFKQKPNNYLPSKLIPSTTLLFPLKIEMKFLHTRVPQHENFCHSSKEV